MPRILRSAAIVLVSSLTLALTACSDDSSDDTSDNASDGSWPRTVQHEAGETEIAEQPETIVSTSVTLTGSLVAMDAPVTATAAASTGPLTDDKGFFSQWATAADEAGVEVLYDNLELDLEAVEAAAPDLIIGSSIGQDATLEAYDQLSDIAPTIMIDYGSKSWQDVVTELGAATGLEDQADGVIADFDSYLEEQSAQIEPPEGGASVATYNAGQSVNVFNEQSAQAQILQGLGFEYVAGPPEIAQEERSDVSFYTLENGPAALENTESLFLIPLGGDPTEAFTSDELMANVPAVQNEQVYTTPVTSFRMDFYSATELVDSLVEQFGA